MLANESNLQFGLISPYNIGIIGYASDLIPETVDTSKGDNANPWIVYNRTQSDVWCRVISQYCEHMGKYDWPRGGYGSGNNRAYGLHLHNARINDHRYWSFLPFPKEKQYVLANEPYTIPTAKQVIEFARTYIG